MFLCCCLRPWVNNKGSFPDPGWGEENVRIRPSNNPRSRYGTGNVSSMSSSGALPPFVMAREELLQLRPPPPKVPQTAVLSSTSRENYVSGSWRVPIIQLPKECPAGEKSLNRLHELWMSQQSEDLGYNRDRYLSREISGTNSTPHIRSSPHSLNPWEAEFDIYGNLHYRLQ
jgi:hypothetical protein